MSEQYEIIITPEALTFSGVPVEDIVDQDAERYTQRNTLNRHRSVQLAFRAGQIVEREAVRSTASNVRLIPLVDVD